MGPTEDTHIGLISDGRVISRGRLLHLGETPKCVTFLTIPWTSANSELLVLDDVL